MKLDKNIFWLIIGSILPLILLFLMPALGIEDSNFIMFFLIALFLGHYFILSRYVEEKREQRKTIHDRPESHPAATEKDKSTKTIHVKSFGLAFGITGALLYLGCVLVMLTVGREGTVRFFNSLLHGLDTSSIIRMQVPWWEALIGVVEVFIISWLIGACIAAIYKISTNRSQNY